MKQFSPIQVAAGGSQKPLFQEAHETTSGNFHYSSSSGNGVRITANMLMKTAGTYGKFHDSF